VIVSATATAQHVAVFNRSSRATGGLTQLFRESRLRWPDALRGLARSLAASQALATFYSADRTSGANPIAPA